MQFSAIILAIAGLAAAVPNPVAVPGPSPVQERQVVGTCVPGSYRCQGNSIYVGGADGNCQLSANCNQCVEANGGAYCT